MDNWIYTDSGKMPVDENVVQILYSDYTVSAGEWGPCGELSIVMWYDCYEECDAEDSDNKRVIAWQPMAKAPVWQRRQPDNSWKPRGPVTKANLKPCPSRLYNDEYPKSFIINSDDQANHEERHLAAALLHLGLEFNRGVLERVTCASKLESGKIKGGATKSIRVYYLDADSPHSITLMRVVGNVYSNLGKIVSQLFITDHISTNKDVVKPE